MAAWNRCNVVAARANGDATDLVAISDLVAIEEIQEAKFLSAGKVGSDEVERYRRRPNGAKADDAVFQNSTC